jgi:hypothetical protein
MTTTLTSLLVGAPDSVHVGLINQPFSGHLKDGNQRRLAINGQSGRHRKVGITSSICFSFCSFSSFALCRRACSNLEGRDLTSGEV